MKEILYDVFIRGVIPLAIVGTLGYLVKKYFENHKSEFSKLLRRVLLVVIALISVYMIYDYISEGTFKDYVPGETAIVGAQPVVGLSNIYWEIDSSKVYSLPLRVKPNRIHLLKMNFSQYPVKVIYQVGDESHSLNLHTSDEPLLNILLEDLTHHQDVVLSDINRDGERLLNLRFQVNKPTRLLSFSLVRYAPIDNKIIGMGLICIVVGFFFFMIDRFLSELQNR